MAKKIYEGLDVKDDVIVDGQVGVGTASPTAKLDVVGNIKADRWEAKTQSNIPTMGYEGHNLLNYGFLQTSAGLTALNSASGQTLDFRINNAVKYSIEGNTLKGNSGLGMKIGAFDDLIGLGVQNQLLEFIVAESGSDFVFGHGTSGFLTKLVTIEGTGNMGIGTATPTAKLHVQTSTSAGANNALLVQNNLLGGTDLLTVKDDGKSVLNGRLGINGDTTQGAQTYQLYVNKDTGATKVFGFFNNGVKKMELDSGSNLTLNASGTSTIVGLGVNAAFGTTLKLDAQAVAIDSLSSGTPTFRVRQSGTTLIGGAYTNTATLQVKEGTTAGASIQMRSGVRPTTPFAGDMIFDGADFEGYNGSSWVQFGGSATDGNGIFDATNDDSTLSSNFGFRVADTLTVKGVTGANLVTFNTTQGLNVGNGTTSANIIVDTSNSTPLSIKRSGIELVKVTYNGANPTIKMYDQSAVQRVNINCEAFAGDTYFNHLGNTGFGLNNPTAKLHVQTSTSAGSNNAFLVENNIGGTAGDLLTIKDDGYINMNNSVFVDNPAYGASLAIPNSATAPNRYRFDTSDGSHTLTNAGVVNMGGYLFVNSPSYGGTVGISNKGTNPNMLRIDSAVGASTNVFRRDGGVYFETGGTVSTGFSVGTNVTTGITGSGLFRVIQQASENLFSLHSSAVGFPVLMNVDGNGNMGIGGAATSTSTLNISNLPTSSAGLVAGDIWNNGGVLSIV